MIEITEQTARKVLQVVDAGLAKGIGEPVPGQMCVEAAVCFAMDLPHGDEPDCVSPVLRSLKIRLNDANWSSNTARASGLRRLAVAQLGSAGALNNKLFAKRVAELAIRTYVPAALRVAASVHKDKHHAAALNDAADRCEREGTKESARNAKTAADAAAAAHTADAAAAAHTAAHAADVAAHAAAAVAAVAAVAHAHAAVAAADRNQARRDAILSEFAEGVVQILIEMDAPGCVWLPLTKVRVTP